MSMLSPGGVGRSRPYAPPRRRGGRIKGVLAALAVLGLVAASAWWFLLRESEPETRSQAAACGGAKPRPAVAQPAFKPQQVTVNVYNASSRKGLAAATAAALRKRGFAIGQIANDPLNRKLAAPAEIRSGAKGRSRTPTVALQVAGARSSVDKRTDLTVDLVLGPKFTTLRTPAQISALLAPPKPPGCG